MQVFEFFHIRLCQIESSQTCLVTSNLALEQVVCPLFFFWGGGGSNDLPVIKMVYVGSTGPYPAQDLAVLCLVSLRYKVPCTAFLL